MREDVRHRPADRRLSAGIRLKQEFLALVENQYGVRPKAVLGKDTKEVNDWVSQQTGRKVQAFLAANFPRAPGANAVSAAYFKGASGPPKPCSRCSFFSRPGFVAVVKQGSG